MSPGQTDPAAPRPPSPSPRSRPDPKLFKYDRDTIFIPPRRAWAWVGRLGECHKTLAGETSRSRWRRRHSTCRPVHPPPLLCLFSGLYNYFCQILLLTGRAAQDGAGRGGRRGALFLHKHYVVEQQWNPKLFKCNAFMYTIFIMFRSRRPALESGSESICPTHPTTPLIRL